MLSRLAVVVLAIGLGETPPAEAQPMYRMSTYEASLQQYRLLLDSRMEIDEEVAYLLRRARRVPFWERPRAYAAAFEAERRSRAKQAEADRIYPRLVARLAVCNVRSDGKVACSDLRTATELGFSMGSERISADKQEAILTFLDFAGGKLADELEGRPALVGCPGVGTAHAFGLQGEPELPSGPAFEGRSTMITPSTSDLDAMLELCAGDLEGMGINPELGGGGDAGYQRTVSRVKEGTEAALDRCDEMRPDSSLAAGGFSFNTIERSINHGVVPVLNGVSKAPEGGLEAAVHEIAVSQLKDSGVLLAESVGKHIVSQNVTSVAGRVMQSAGSGMFLVDFFVSYAKAFKQFFSDRANGTTMGDFTYDYGRGEVLAERMYTKDGVQTGYGRLAGREMEGCESRGGSYCEGLDTACRGASNGVCGDRSDEARPEDDDEEGHVGTEAGGAESGGDCASELECDPCASARAWWAWFSSRCDATDWTTYECRSYIASNFGHCVDPALVYDPEGNTVCRDPTSAELQAEAERQACEARQRFMYCMPDQRCGCYDLSSLESDAFFQAQAQERFCQQVMSDGNDGHHCPDLFGGPAGGAEAPPPGPAPVLSIRRQLRAR